MFLEATTAKGGPKLVETGPRVCDDMVDHLPDMELNLI